MNATPIWNLAAIKAIARTPAEMVEAHCALIDAHLSDLEAAKNQALPVRERRAAYFRWAAGVFNLEMPIELSMELLGIPEDNEPLTAEQRASAWELCATYERQIREGDPANRDRSYANLTQIYEDFGLTGPTLETILNSAPKVLDAACEPLNGGAA